MRLFRHLYHDQFNTVLKIKCTTNINVQEYLLKVLYITFILYNDFLNTDGTTFLSVNKTYSFCKYKR